MTIKEEIQKLQTGQRYIIPETTIEIWNINGIYFLFDILKSNLIKFAGYYSDIDELLEKIESWAVD